MNSYRLSDLRDKAHQLTLSICKATENFPQSSSAAVTERLQSLAAGISETVACACVQTSMAGLEAHLCVAAWHLSKLDYQLLLARDLGYLEQSQYQNERTALQNLQGSLQAALQDISFQVEWQNNDA